MRIYMKKNALFISLLILILNSTPLVAQQLPQRASDISWSPDGQQIAIAGRPTGVFDTQQGIYTEFTTQLTDSIAWNGNGDRIATLSANSNYGWTIEVWNVTSGEVTQTIEDDYQYVEELGEIAWHPTENLIAVTGWGIRVWDTTTGILVFSDQNGSEFQTNITLSADWKPDGTQLASGHPLEGMVRIWDRNTGNLVQELIVDGSGIEWSPSGEQLATNNLDEILIWDTASWEVIKTIDALGLIQRGFSWEGDYLALTTLNGDVEIWDVDTSTLVRTIDVEDSIRTVALSPDGTLIAYDQTNLPDITFDVVPIANAQLFGSVWQDTNMDGLRTGEESNGIADVTVNLLDITDTQVATTTTASDGTYTFEVEPDTPYTIEVIPPQGFTFTTPDVGEDDTLDSDIDPATGRTPPITVTVGQSDDTWDAGVVFCNLDEEEDFGER